MAKFNIVALFEITCPWCYIGHTRLHKAIESHLLKHPQDVFNIKLVPLYLNDQLDPKDPPFPVPTKSRKQLREQTYGAVYASKVIQNIRAAVGGTGLSLKFNGLTGPTRNGHRLIYRASKVGGEAMASSVLHELFVRYHEQEVDITKLDVLTDVGVGCRVGSEQEVREFLLSGEETAEVDALATQARKTRQGGVPQFDVSTEDSDNGGFTVNGAREVEEWGRIFERLSQ
jgi:predicted DsbA family dithiol-disulfide isomerase